MATHSPPSRPHPSQMTQDSRPRWCRERGSGKGEGREEAGQGRTAKSPPCPCLRTRPAQHPRSYRETTTPATPSHLSACFRCFTARLMLTALRTGSGDACVILRLTARPGWATACSACAALSRGLPPMVVERPDQTGCAKGDNGKEEVRGGGPHTHGGGLPAGGRVSSRGGCSDGRGEGRCRGRASRGVWDGDARGTRHASACTQLQPNWLPRHPSRGRPPGHSGRGWLTRLTIGV